MPGFHPDEFMVIRGLPDDPAPYTVTITDLDMLQVLHVVEECLMRLDDFIDLDYGKYLRDETRDALMQRREDVRDLLARLRKADEEATR